MPKGQRVRTHNDLPSRTVQSDRHEAEIAHILQKFGATGIIDHLAQVDATFQDVSEFTDYSDMMMQLKDAERVFYGLPPKIRRLFNSDVAVWLDTAHDADKLEALRPELEKLGLVPPQPGAPDVQMDSPSPSSSPDSPPDSSS